VTIELTLLPRVAWRGREITGSRQRGLLALYLFSDVDEASADRPTALATGRAGDVILCHPFLVHAAQPHHGTRPRFMAQPPLMPALPYELNRPDADYSPVEFAIRRALSDTG
jgi:hypothetical protein